MKKFNMLGWIAVFSLVFGVGMIATGCGTASVELTFHEAVAATCETAGNVAYYEDEATGKFYSDAEGENELTSVVIAALGHDYVRSDYKAQGYLSSQSAGFYYICSHDSTHYYIDYQSTIVSVWSETGLTDAVSNVASGSAIVLEADIVMSTNVNVTNKEITFDLHGHKLSFSATGTGSAGLYASGENGVITLDDSVGTGAFEQLNGYGVMVKEGGTVVVNGGTYTTLYSCFSSNNTNGVGNYEINGGTFYAISGTPIIYMPAQGYLTITGGTFYSGLLIRMGDVKISGGTIYAFNPQKYINQGIVASGYYDDFEFGTMTANYKGQNIILGNALTVYVGAYSFTYGSNTDNSLTMEITGGTFINDNNESTTTEANNTIQIYVVGKVAQVSDITVTGGSFSSSNGELYSLVESGAETFGGSSYYNGSTATNTVEFTDPTGLLSA